MKSLKAWIVLNLVLLGGTITLGVARLDAQHGAEVAACERVDEVRRGTVGELSRLVKEGADALLAWQPGQEAPAPFGQVRRISDGEPWEWMFPLADDQVRVGFVKGDLLIAATVDGAFVEGTIEALRLRDLLTAAPDVGPSGAREDGARTRYSALGFVDAGGQIQWLERAVAKKKKKDDEKSEVEKSLEEQKSKLLGAGAKQPELLRQIEAGTPSEYTRGELAPSYRGFSNDPVFGTWDRWPDSPDLWVFAEIDTSVAEAELPGLRLGWDGKVFKVLLWWHLGVGLTVLSLVGTLWTGLRSRNQKLGVIGRTFGFVKPYIGGLIMVLFLGLCSQGVSASKVLFTAAIFDYALADTVEESIRNLWVIGGWIAVAAVVAGVTTYFHRYLAGYYQVGIMADVRLAIGRKLAQLPISYHDRHRSGDLIARIEGDSSHMRRVLNLAFKNAAVEPFKLGWAAVFAFVLNAKLALVILTLPLVMAPLFRIMRRIKKRSQKRQAQRAEISHVLIQLLAGIKVVKAFSGEEREAERLDKANGEMVVTARKVARLQALSEGMLESLQILGAAIVLVAGGYLILNGGVSLGDMAGFMLVLQQFYTGAKKLTTTANQLVSASAGVERVYQVLDAKSDLLDGPDEMPRTHLEQGIRLEGVCFSYRKKRILHDVDLDIPAGKVVALVGPTGAGKSTICSLAARFYDATEGRVLYDGVDVRRYTVRSLVENIGIVTQDAFLFNSSIEENIRYGRADATREEIEEAARAAFVHGEITSMEKGYAKICGERGTAVSGGQRQRITIARAILADAPVLILDEATSALDSHAEQQVQSALERLVKGRTVIVVAHRLSTIMHADKVVVLDRGKVVEQGSPDELLARPDGRFKRMVDLQMRSGDDAVPFGEEPDDGDDV